MYEQSEEYKLNNVSKTYQDVNQSNVNIKYDSETIESTINLVDYENNHENEQNDKKIDSKAKNFKFEIQNTKYPLVRYTQLDSTDLSDILDLCINIIEKYSNDNEKICKLIKEILDQKYRPNWNVVIGSNYASEITYESKNILYFYFGIDLAVLLWKFNYRF